MWFIPTVDRSIVSIFSYQVKRTYRQTRTNADGSHNHSVLYRISGFNGELKLPAMEPGDTLEVSGRKNTIHVEGSLPPEASVVIRGSSNKVIFDGELSMDAITDIGGRRNELIQSINPV